MKYSSNLQHEYYMSEQFQRMFSVLSGYETEAVPVAHQLITKQTECLSITLGSENEKAILGSLALPQLHFCVDGIDINCLAAVSFDNKVPGVSRRILGRVHARAYLSYTQVT